VSDALKPLSAALATLAASASSASAVAAASASAVSLPAALANLASGNLLAGIVVERGRGTVLLKTDKGVIQLATMLPLKLGASVMLEVQSVGAQMRFAIVSVDHRAPQATATDIAEFAPEPPPLSSSLRGDGGAPTGTAGARAPLIGRIVTAEIVAPPDVRAAAVGDAIPTLLRRVAMLTASLGHAPADPRAAATSTPVLLPAAETLETILAAIEALPPGTAEALLNTEPKVLPAQAKMPDTTEAPGTLPSREAQAPAITPRVDAAPAPPSTRAIQSLPAGTSVPAASTGSAEPAAINPATPKLIAIRVLDIVPLALADARSIPPRPTDDSITLLGTVASADANHVTLATPLGTLRLPIAIGVPVGSRMAFEVLVSPQTPGADAPLSTSESLPPVRTLDADPPRDWPAVRELAAALPQNSDASAILPKPGQALGPALLAFLVALRGGGNAKAWFDTAIDSFDSSDGTRLVDRVRDEVSVQARAAAVPDRNGWQTMAVPLLDGRHLSEIRVHVQKRRKRDNDSEEPGSRFIVEATLSTLGPLQLDGLVRASRFDLIVRTQRPLPPPVRRDIETLFRESLSDTAYRGGVSFRGDARTSSIAGTRGGNGVVV
jgi:hypothetical protein